MNVHMGLHFILRDFFFFFFWITGFILEKWQWDNSFLKMKDQK